ncbi:hypothetical protein HMI54_010238 [Coelomomyces lativittatus]|nr:hypothetical protein HMI54_010238 [Coelomomyces lativittatus]
MTNIFSISIPSFKLAKKNTPHDSHDLIKDEHPVEECKQKYPLVKKITRMFKIKRAPNSTLPSKDTPSKLTCLPLKQVFAHYISEKRVKKNSASVFKFFALH